MSDIDTARLRALTEAATTIEVVESIPQDGFECYWLRVNGREIGSINGPQCDERDGWAAYIAAVSPDVVTALCDRIDALERTAAAAGRALVEAQRDAGRYQWLRERATASHTQQGTPHGVHYPTTWRIVTGGSDTDLDAAIDAAIAAKEQSND